MCPLRLILIFLSATLAGFFVIRNLKSQPQTNDEDEDDDPRTRTDTNETPNTSLTKVRKAVESGFWTCLDMASGRYLWRHLVSSHSKPST